MIGFVACVTKLFASRIPHFLVMEAPELTEHKMAAARQWTTGG